MDKRQILKAKEYWRFLYVRTKFQLVESILWKVGLAMLLDRTEIKIDLFFISPDDPNNQETSTIIFSR
jgi:hypothetical protein